jgi:carbonic anhydrase
MKYATQGLMAFLSFTLACNGPDKQVQQNDSTQTQTAHDSTGATTGVSTGGNLVKYEAPDADTKTTQGYALPRYGDGLVQSPINIVSDSAVKDNSVFISIKFSTGITAIENLGHTIQLDFKEGSTATAGGKTYSCKQVHFHTPSEHMIDGMTYPMEMHIVNVLMDSNAQKNPQYFVIGFLFKMGRENKFIQEFLNAIPREEKKDNLQPGIVNFEDLFKTIPKNEPQGYFSYKGSLTTPPYSETVSWMVKKSILEASPEQIEAIEKLEGNNARHVQALYARKILSH